MCSIRTNYGDLSGVSDAELLEIMYQPYTIPKCGGISEAAKRKLRSQAVIERLKELKTDYAVLAGDTTVSDFACAALDIIGIEKYSGNREQTIQLIKIRLDLGKGRR